MFKSTALFLGVVLELSRQLLLGPPRKFIRGVPVNVLDIDKRLNFRTPISLGVALILFLMSFSTSATTSATMTQNAERLLERDVMASMKTMSKDVRIYHYFNIQHVWDELTTPAGRNGFVDRYLLAATGRFWDLQYHAASYINAGPGLYLAIDPYVAYAQGFGNTMIELRVPKGTRYINVVRSLPVGKDTIDALVAEGIIARHEATIIFSKASGATKLGFYRDTLKNMTNPGFEKFRSLVLHIFKSNAIQFIEYNWDSKLGGYCKLKSASAFNYIGSQPLDTTYSGIPMLSSLTFPHLTSDEVELKERVEKFRELLSQIDGYKKRGMKVPLNLISSFFNTIENNKIKAMTYGCEGAGL